MSVLSRQFLVENLNRKATWDAVGDKLITRVRAQAQNPNEGIYDTHPIAWGLRFDENDPEYGNHHEQAREDFLDKIEGMSPVGHAKTYGPLIGRIYANGHNLQFGEDDERIRDHVQRYHELKAANVFQPYANSNDPDHKILKKANDTRSLNTIEDLESVFRHPIVRQHFQQKEQDVKLTNDYSVLWKGKDAFGQDVTAYVPHTVEAARNLYGVGKNGVKPEFTGVNGVGWCTVQEQTFKNYTKMGSKNSNSPLIIFKRDHEDHPFLQVHAITGQVHGHLPQEAGPSPADVQKARMTNASVKASKVDKFLPGVGLTQHMQDAKQGREARAVLGNARNHELAAVRNANDLQLAEYAAHEDPEYRQTAVQEAGARGIQAIVNAAVDDPDRNVVRTAVSLTTNPEIHNRFARPGADSLDKIALARNIHVSPKIATKLFNQSRMPSAGYPDARTWDSVEYLTQNQIDNHGDAYAIAHNLIGRSVPKRAVDPEEVGVVYGRRQNNFRRSAHYQDTLSMLGHSLLDNASPHTAGARDLKTGTQEGQRSLEELMINGGISEVNDHIRRITNEVANKSLDPALVARIEKMPMQTVHVNHGNGLVFEKLFAERKLAERGYRPKYYLQSPYSTVRTAAVIGLHPVVQGRQYKETPEELNGGNVWRREKGKANMFKPEIIQAARKEDEVSPLKQMVPFTKKWKDLKSIIIDKVDQAVATAGDDRVAGMHEVAEHLIDHHQDDELLANRWVNHPSSRVREVIAKNAHRFDSSHQLLSTLINSPSYTITSYANQSAAKKKHWDLVHQIEKRQGWVPHIIATDPEYLAYKNTQTEELEAKISLKKMLIEYATL